MRHASDVQLAIVGLGYVGLPLAVEFGKHRSVMGFDINDRRVCELEDGRDATFEVSAEDLKQATRLRFTSELDNLSSSNFFIISVPTPLDIHKRPDLGPLLEATRMVGSILQPGGIVVYESTVYPGATEEECVPILEEVSGLTFLEDFDVGYSPERVNPGDRRHRVTTIVKITSGSSPEVADLVDDVYQEIVVAGTCKASSIRVAEAAKVIENTQRDLNIALVNELSMIFTRMGLDTEEILAAAGSKWNFLPFRPGLVGGHCIGIDPYYLTHKAQSVGHHPELILAGRRINDTMGSYVVSQLVKAMLRKRIQVDGSSILIMGLAFKENCPDTRNTKVMDIVRELATYHAEVDVFDPWVAPHEAEREHGIKLITEPRRCAYDAIILAVAHDQFRQLSPDRIHSFGRASHVLYDLKFIVGKDAADLRL
jgi:UDP-N-acetyl-D-galactosamine dehydrogenase